MNWKCYRGGDNDDAPITYLKHPDNLGVAERKWLRKWHSSNPGDYVGDPELKGILVEDGTSKGSGNRTSLARWNDGGDDRILDDLLRDTYHLIGATNELAPPQRREIEEKSTNSDAIFLLEVPRGAGGPC